MLKFEESERPSFMELAKLVLTSTENTIESPKNGVKPTGDAKKFGSKTVSKVFSQNNLKDSGNPNNAAQAEVYNQPA